MSSSLLKKLPRSSTDAHCRDTRMSIHVCVMFFYVHMFEQLEPRLLRPPWWFCTGAPCRPRGFGEVNESGEIENFKLISFDLVPSTTDAFANIKENDSLKLSDNE